MLTFHSKLTEATLRARVKALRLVITDCDGVLTDGGVYYGADGDEQRKFSVRDGMGFELLRSSGIVCGILSGEAGPAIATRAKKLGLEEVHLGVREKGERIASLAAARGVPLTACAYLGDDLNDLPVFRALEGGLLACPEDAIPAIKELTHIVLPVRGGNHAFRAFADIVLPHRI